MHRPGGLPSPSPLLLSSHSSTNGLILALGLQFVIYWLLKSEIRCVLFHGLQVSALTPLQRC